MISDENKSSIFAGNPVLGQGVLVKATVTGYRLRVQFFNPQLETRNSQQSPTTYFMGT